MHGFKLKRFIFVGIISRIIGEFKKIFWIGRFKFKPRYELHVA